MKAIIISDLHSDDNFTEARIKLAKEQNPDAIFLLGDIKSTDLYKIEESFWNDNIKIPMYGITGDDDTPNMLDKFEHIQDIDGKVVDVCGYKVGGFAGSTKYKHGLFSMRDESEAENILKNMPECDIFLSHETGLHYMDSIINKKNFEDSKRITMIEEQKALLNQKTTFQKFFDKILNKKDDTNTEHTKVQTNVFANEDRMYQGFKAIDDYINRVQPKVHFFGHYHLPSIDVTDSVEIVQKTKNVHGKDIMIKTVKAKDHKELAAFDIGQTTCACNYLFSVFEIGERFSFLPLVTEEEIEEKRQTELKIEEKLFEDSYFVNLSKKEKEKYLGE